MQDKLILPKPHLSWSQLSCWLSNPNRYRKEYFESGDKLDSKYLRFGKGFAVVMEEISKHPELLKDKMWVMNKFGLDIDTPEGKEFVENLKFYDTPEFEIKTNVLRVPILSYLDTYNSKENVFREYKTGKLPWTKAKVVKHGQLIFYATALKHSCGKIPSYCDLDWIETKEGSVEVSDFWRENENQINVTGRVVSFHREFDEREIEKMENLIVKVANEISEAYIKFIKEI